MTPKPKCIIKGEPWWDFLFCYEFEGSQWEFAVCARSEAEAHERMKRIALARYEGQAHGGPIPLYRGWYVPFFAWWKNAFSRQS